MISRPMPPAPTMPTVLPVSGTTLELRPPPRRRPRALGEALGRGEQQRQDVLGHGHGVGAGRRRPEPPVVHEPEREPVLHAGGLELHPLHVVGQERAQERLLVGGYRRVAVREEDVGGGQVDDLSAPSADRVGEPRGRLRRQPDARGLGRLSGHSGIA